MAKQRNKISHFRTNVFLKNIIGNELINNDNIAILELVKNSFDAASKKVEINFKNIKENDDQTVKTYSNNSSKIIIQDWGIGMNKKDIIDKWLNIAYSEKKEKKKEFGRLLAGAKGIGRFSCDRLGKYLDIYTRRKNDKSYVHLKVDWTKFEVAAIDLEIQNIPVEINLISEKQFKLKSGHENFLKGTIIEISKLKSGWASKTYRVNKKGGASKKPRWDTAPLYNLKKYLEKLINPNQALGEKNLFEIDLYAKDFEKEDESNFEKGKEELVINGKVENKIFTKLDFKTTSIEALIKLEGRNKILTTTLKDKNRIIYEIKEDVTNNHSFSYIDNAYLIIYYLNPYAKIYFARQTGRRSVHFGSIHLFKNGFRIPPYGDIGDDWLGLEIRKGQGQRRFLGTRDIVGRVEIFDTSYVFKEVSSREGLVKNQAYENLTETFYFEAHKRLEKYVVEGIKWDSIPKNALKELNKKGTENNFSDALFSLSEEQKNTYALDAVTSIIKTTENPIVHLYVNSDLIYTLSRQEKEKFEQVYKDFEKFDSNRIDKNIKQSFNKVKLLLDKREEELKLLREQAVSFTSQSLFSKPSSEKDSKEIEELQHHINQATGRINKSLKDLREAITNKENEETLLSYINYIAFENRKITTISRFITQAKFDLLSSETEADLVDFIGQYIENVYINYPSLKINGKQLQVFIFMKQAFHFVMKFRPIDMVFIIDNLFDNSRKANADRIEVRLNMLADNVIEIRFKDNGDGLDKLINEPNKIFEYKFTTTKELGGTGIGLFHVKEIIDTMGGSIVPNPLEKGLEMIIKLKKYI